MASIPNPLNNENPNKIDTNPNNTNAIPIFISTESLHAILSQQTLIDHLQSSLPAASSTLQTPIRQSYSVSQSSSLLLMPSWSSSPSLPYVGVKLVTYFPQNSTLNLPGVHASYVLFSSVTGQTLARNDSETLVMIGAVALASHSIKAHLSARPSLRRVIIWNRTMEKARKLAEEMRENAGFDGVRFESNECLEEIVGLGDIVSCATISETPVVKGKSLKAGAHLDLVGSFKHSMMECDDKAIRRGRLLVDNEAALVWKLENWWVLFERRVIEKGDIGGNLVELIKGEKVGRRSSEEITVFKSVGSAIVDILAAQLVYETYIRKQ